MRTMAESKQKRAVQTRRQVLVSAAELFDMYGFAGTSISRICERAGTTAGAVYHHFGSKEGLAQAVMNSQPDTILPWLESEGLQRLVDITLVWAHQLQTDPLLRAGVRLTGEQAAFGLQDASPYEDWARIMEECLVTAAGKGELQSTVAPRDVAEFVVEACTGVQTVAAVLTGRSDLPARAVRMWQLLLPGIAVADVAARIDLDPTRVQVAPV
jgi:AcrR family transcriptional regulator